MSKNKINFKKTIHSQAIILQCRCDVCEASLLPQFGHPLGTTELLACREHEQRGALPVQGALPGSPAGRRAAQRLQAHGSCERSPAGTEIAQREVCVRSSYFLLRSSLSYNRSKIFLCTIAVVKIEWRGMVEFNK